MIKTLKVNWSSYILKCCRLDTSDAYLTSSFTKGPRSVQKVNKLRVKVDANMSITV